MPAPREGRRWGLGVGAPPVRKGGKLLTRGEGWGGDRTLCVVTRRRLLASAVCAVVACSVRVIRADLLATCKPGAACILYACGGIARLWRLRAVVASLACGMKS